MKKIDEPTLAALVCRLLREFDLAEYTIPAIDVITNEEGTERVTESVEFLIDELVQYLEDRGYQKVLYADKE